MKKIIILLLALIFISCHATRLHQVFKSHVGQKIYTSGYSYDFILSQIDLENKKITIDKITHNYWDFTTITTILNLPLKKGKIYIDFIEIELLKFTDNYIIYKVLKD